jgi:hypothetical protein
MVVGDLPHPPGAIGKIFFPKYLTGQTSQFQRVPLHLNILRAFTYKRDTQLSPEAIIDLLKYIGTSEAY